MLLMDYDKYGKPYYPNVSKNGKYRYGVLPLNRVLQWFADTCEYEISIYCPYCGGTLRKASKGKDQKRCGHCYKALTDTEHRR